MLVLLICELLVYNDYSEAISESILYLLTMGTIGLMIGSFDFDVNYCLKYGQILSYICFVTSLVFLWLTPHKFLMSMRFGYALLPSVLWFLMMSLMNASKINFVLFLAGTFTLLAWGSRGTLLVIVIFILIYLYKYHKSLFAAAAITIIPILTVLRDYLLMFLDSIAGFTHAQKVDKLIALLENDDVLDASSGRDTLYEHCIDLIEQNPLGNGVGFWTKDPAMHGLFPHNVFLHIGTEFGIIGLAVISFIVLYALKKIFDFKSPLFLLLAFFFSISLGRLLVSSMYWARPEFWLFIGLFLCNPLMKKKIIRYTR